MSKRRVIIAITVVLTTVLAVVSFMASKDTTSASAAVNGDSSLSVDTNAPGRTPGLLRLGTSPPLPRLPPQRIDLPPSGLGFRRLTAFRNQEELPTVDGDVDLAVTKRPRATLSPDPPQLAIRNTKENLIDCVCRFGRCLLILSNVVATVHAENDGTDKVTIHLPKDTTTKDDVEQYRQVVAGCGVQLHEDRPVEIALSLKDPIALEPVPGEGDEILSTSIAYIFPKFMANDLLGSLIMGSFQLWMVHRDALYRLSEWLGISETLALSKFVRHVEIVVINDPSESLRWAAGEGATHINEPELELFFEASFFDPFSPLSPKIRWNRRRSSATHTSNLDWRVVRSRYIVIGSYSNSALFGTKSFDERDNSLNKEVQHWNFVINSWAEFKFGLVPIAGEDHGLTSSSSVPIRGGIVAVDTPNGKLGASHLLPEVAKEEVPFEARNITYFPASFGLGDSIRLVRAHSVIITDDSLHLSPLFVFAQPTATWIVLAEGMRREVLAAEMYIATHLMRCKIVKIETVFQNWHKFLLHEYLDPGPISPHEQLTRKRRIKLDSDAREKKAQSNGFDVQCVCPPNWRNVAYQNEQRPGCSLVVRHARVTIVALPSEPAPELPRYVVEVWPNNPSSVTEDQRKVFSDCPVYFPMVAATHKMIREEGDSSMGIPGAAWADRCKDQPTQVAQRTNIKAIFSTLYPYNMFHNLLTPAAYFPVALAMAAVKKVLLRDYSANVSSFVGWSMEGDQGIRPAGPFINLVDDYLLADGKPGLRFATKRNGMNYTSCSEFHAIGAWQVGTVPDATDDAWMFWELNRWTSIVREDLLLRFGEPHGMLSWKGEKKLFSPFAMMPRRYEGAHHEQERARGIGASLFSRLYETFQEETGYVPDILDPESDDDPREQFWHYRSRKLVIAPEGAALTYAFMCRPGTTWIMTDRYLSGRGRDHAAFHTMHLKHSTHVRLIVVRIRDNIVPPMAAIIGEYRRRFYPVSFSWDQNRRESLQNSRKDLFQSTFLSPLVKIASFMILLCRFDGKR